MNPSCGLSSRSVWPSNSKEAMLGRQGTTRCTGRPLAPELAGLAPCSGSIRRIDWRRPALVVPDLAALENVASAVASGVDQIASASPAALQPFVQLIGGDVASAVALSPTPAGVARLSVRESWALFCAKCVVCALRRVNCARSSPSLAAQRKPCGRRAPLQAPHGVVSNATRRAVWSNSR